MMKGKNLLVHITHAPVIGDTVLKEILLALALASAPERHKIRMIFSGDGVYFALSKFKPTGWEKILIALQ
ncbi:MAG: hypothetical protein J7M18_05680, partial [Candidatus Eremiobacteraeota bacterium]|nr:hypothetical protein [Candidatus Eremiobacteraeota bacterium]